jgi:hypothetical protein
MNLFPWTFTQPLPEEQEVASRRANTAAAKVERAFLSIVINQG